MRLFLVILSALAWVACAPEKQMSMAAPAASSLLLQNVAVIDGAGGVPLRARDVLIEGERIVGIWPTGSRPAPVGTERLDLTGRYLIPGLIDSHVHLKSRQRDPGMIERVLDSVLRGGVTTVRDMGGKGELRELRLRADDLASASPDILLSSLVIGPTSNFWMTGEQSTYIASGGSPGATAWFRRIERTEDAAPAVRAAADWGAAGIKVHSGMNPDMLRVVADEARRANLQLWTHANIGPARPGDAVSAGASILSHADMIAYEGLVDQPAGFAGRPYIERTRLAMAATPVDGPALGRLFEQMRGASACLEPTLFVFTPREPSEMEAYARYAAEATARAHRMGVRICAGTDAIGGSTPNLPEELKLLVERVGLTPLEAITAATHGNAVALGLTDRGLIRAGMRADLVVLSADPSLDITNLRRVEAVFKRGRIYRPPPRSE